MSIHSRIDVSVIVPVYNVKPFLAECVNSIINQTYQNVEIILVDDGSNDGSGLLCDEMALRDDRIKVFHNLNFGVSYTRNFAIQQAKGKYILPVDGDDVIKNTYIEKAVQIMEESPSVGIVYCEAEFFGERKGKWHLPEFTIGRMLVYNVIFVTALFRKDDWQKVGGYSEKMTQGIEDYDFWLSILELGRDVYCIPEVLFKYRIRAFSRTKNFEKDNEKILAMYQVLHRRHKGLYVKYYDEFSTYVRAEMLESNAKLKRIKRLIPFYGLLERNKRVKDFLKQLIYGG